MINVDGQPHFGVPMQAGNIYTIAGRALVGGLTSGFSGDGSPATNSQLNAPNGLALDLGGNVYIADIDNCRIRMINADGQAHFGQSMQTGYIYSIAGAGTCGYSGDNGPATSAWLNFPLGVAVDNDGNVFIGDSYNNMIRRVDAATGIITTVAGNTSSDTGASYNGWNSSAAKVPPMYPPNDGFSGDGGPAVNAKLNAPRVMVFDRFNNLFFTDSLNNAIRKIDTTTGIITTVVGQGGAWFTAETFSVLFTSVPGQGGPWFTFNGPGVNANAKCLKSRALSNISDIPFHWPQDHFIGLEYLNSSGGAASLSSSQTCEIGGGTMIDAATPGMTVLNSAGAIAPSSVYTIQPGFVELYEYRFPQSGYTNVTFSGDGGLATDALINQAKFLTVDLNGSIYFFDAGAFRYRMVPAVDGFYFGSTTLMQAGHIYTIAGNGSLGFWSGDGGPAKLAGF
jgi:sugar lactone lactonase YvrE